MGEGIVSKVRIEDISWLLIQAEHLSTVDNYVASTRRRAYFAELIFNKFHVHLQSFNTLFSYIEKSNILDIGALAALSRMIVESHNAIQYFCGDGVSKDEMEFRGWLYLLHFNKNSKAILDKLNLGKTGKIYESDKLQNKVIIDLLEKNNYFKTLDKKEKRNLLTGKKAFYWRGAKPEGPFSKKHEEAVYKLLSNSVHTFQLGNSNFLDGGERNPLNNNALLFLVSETTTTYSASTINMYISIRRPLGKRLDRESKSEIRKLATNHKLNEWLESQCK